MSKSVQASADNMWIMSIVVDIVYENKSLSGEETGIFCPMNFLLQKASQAKQAKQSWPHTVIHSIETWHSSMSSFVSV